MAERSWDPECCYSKVCVLPALPSLFSPLVEIPDSASKFAAMVRSQVLKKQCLLTSPSNMTFRFYTVMVGRVSVLFRGAGSALNYQVKTADNWMKHAARALRDSSA